MELRAIKLTGQQDGKLSTRATFADEQLSEVRVFLALHDDVSIGFYANYGLSFSPDEGVWKGELEPGTPFAGQLLEIARVTCDGTEVIAIPDALQLAPASGIGPFDAGPAAAAEKHALHVNREALFDTPLGSDDATHPTFGAVYLVDNIRLTQINRVPGIRIIPLQSPSLGLEIAAVLNDCLAQLNFDTIIDPADWLKRYQQTRPAAVVFAPTIRAANTDDAIQIISADLELLLELVAIRRQAAPRVLGGVIGELRDGAYLHRASWIAARVYAGNLLGGWLSGEDPKSLLTSWDALKKDRRAQLWTSLYANAIDDPRLDYQIFRIFNLLEGIAKEVIPKGTKVPGQAGTNTAYEMQPNNKPYTVAQARGALFLLVSHIANVGTIAPSSFAADPQTGDVWSESALWVAIRNAVAHRGSWDLPDGQTPPQAWLDTDAALVARGNDGSARSGMHALYRGLREAAQACLNLTIAGKL